MRRVTVVFLLVVMLLAVPLGAPPDAQRTEGPFGGTILSADGDTSSDSITSFSSTLASDTLFYPDLFNINNPDTVDASAWTADSQTNTVSSTEAKDGTDWILTDSNPVAASVEALMNFTIPNDYIEGFDVAVYGKTNNVAHNFNLVQVYDHVGTTWVDYDDFETTDNWYNNTYYDPDYWSTTDDVVMMRFYIGSTLGDDAIVYLDYVALTWYNMTLVDAEHYGESFADVSDWTYNAPDGSDSISTDGDVMTMVNDWAGGSDSDYVYSNTPSGIYPYYEVRYRLNDSTVGTVILATYSADDLGGSNKLWQTMTKTTSWTTLKIYDADTIECIGFMLQTTATSGDAELIVDYLRAGDETEFGWQHDGSTTQGVTDDSAADIVYEYSTDGDILNLTATNNGASTEYTNFYFSFDTTTTVAGLESDYYPFFAIRVNYSGPENWYAVRANYDGKYADLTPTKNQWETLYCNVAAGDALGISQIRLFDYIAAGASTSWYVDWNMAYSIANYTYSSSGALTDEYFYVDGSSQLVVEKSAGGYMALHSDPTISVDGNTYNVINASITPQATGFTFHRQSDYFVILNQETRGEMPAAVLTDYYMKFSGNYDYTLSAIKFIEDGTAPSVVRSNANPPEPDDDESVTLSAVVTDAVEVYTVKFNAITSPAGFSDVDYSATEIADNLWTYSFSSGDLPTGYYCFKVIASDGANENALTTEPEFLDFTVRASEIVIEEITLIGAGSDFTMMQFSARINKDCTYTIYEESENNAEAATYTGTVSEPSFNLAWTKLSTTDTNVNFTIKFVNGSLTENYTSQYQVAQTALAINSYDWGFTQNEVLLNYDMTKGGTYTVYLDEVQDSTGAFTTGSNFVNWSRPSSTSPSEVRAAVKVTDGTTTLWMNRTYDEYSVTALSIQTLLLSTTGPNITIFVQTSLGNATITVYQDDVQKATGAEGTTLAYSKSTTAGTYNIAIKIFAGTTAGTKWHNDTYTVAIDYAWSTIYVFDQGDPATYIPWQSFDLYVNSSLIDENEFYDRTDYVYNIVLKDKFGDVVYNQTQAFARTYRLTLSMYKFKIKSYIVGKTVVTVVSSGGGSQSEVLFHESEVEWWLFASKTYYWTWTVQAEDGQTGTWGDGSHYFPAQGHNYETLSDTWYSPTQADGFELDAWGLKYVYDNLPQPGGDNDGDAEGGVLSAFDPRKNPLGPGTWLVIGFVGLGYMVYGLDDRNKTGEWPHTKARRRLKRKRGRGQYRPKEQKGSYG